jgi:hypothetical protein
MPHRSRPRGALSAVHSGHSLLERRSMPSASRTRRPGWSWTGKSTLSAATASAMRLQSRPYTRDSLRARSTNLQDDRRSPRDAPGPRDAALFPSTRPICAPSHRSENRAAVDGQSAVGSMPKPNADPSEVHVGALSTKPLVGNRSAACRDEQPSQSILHIAPQRHVDCQLRRLRASGGSFSMPLSRGRPIIQAAAARRRIASQLARDR